MTKRCKNCGWPNDDSNVKCEKCNALLDEGASSRPAFSQTVREASTDMFKRTVSEDQFFGGDEQESEEPKVVQEPKETTNSGVHTCPNCGYPVRPSMSVCPDCGTIIMVSKDNVINNKGKTCPKCGSINNADAVFCNHCGAELDPKQRNNTPNTNQGNHQGTINPWMKPDNSAFCTLKPVAWAGESNTHQPLTFSGESVILNRANTDPNNQSITTSEQAELSYEGGEWYILDKSTQHTTYVLASQKIKLHKGDTIVLGNRLFEFN